MGGGGVKAGPSALLERAEGCLLRAGEPRTDRFDGEGMGKRVITSPRSWVGEAASLLLRSYAGIGGQVRFVKCLGEIGANQIARLRVPKGSSDQRGYCPIHLKLSPYVWNNPSEVHDTKVRKAIRKMLKRRGRKHTIRASPSCNRSKREKRVIVHARVRGK